MKTARGTLAGEETNTAGAGAFCHHKGFKSQTSGKLRRRLLKEGEARAAPGEKRDCALQGLENQHQGKAPKEGGRLEKKKPFDVKLWGLGIRNARRTKSSKFQSTILEGLRRNGKET